MYFASRYDKGDADFLNIPLSKEEYLAFVMDLLQAEVVLPHDFEEGKYFESCLPIETIASRGPMTLAFGPMKPVGLNDPKTGKRAFAVIQLRAENRDRTAYNLVGFQTKMKYPEQMRVFRKIPGLENAEFLRLGSMHRNTFLDSPRVLEPTLQMKKRNTLLVAGQLTGTEGYLESSATGFLAGLNAARLIAGETPVTLPPETMLGALIGYITDASRENFQPINSNFGILPALDPASRDRQERNQRHEARALASMEGWLSGSKFPSIFPATAERYTHLS
jgi:methylenetetrahydrofolate--tRNA-(uracil-5-)-methyltransferase